MNKICSKCKISKPISDFHKNHGGEYGVHSQCKICKCEYKKDYRHENKDKRLKYKEKIKHIIIWRRLLKHTLNRMNIKKNDTTIDLLGYSANDLKQHIESLFTDGMSWDNYGEWHVDHIKDVSRFDKNELPSIVNSLNNLRPLWKTTREINGIIYEGNLNRKKYYKNGTES